MPKGMPCHWQGVTTPGTPGLSLIKIKSVRVCLTDAPTRDVGVDGGVAATVGGGRSEGACLWVSNKLSEFQRYYLPFRWNS